MKTFSRYIRVVFLFFLSLFRVIPSVFMLLSVYSDIVKKKKNKQKKNRIEKRKIRCLDLSVFGFIIKENKSNFCDKEQK
jgi:hypothetical protein